MDRRPIAGRRFALANPFEWAGAACFTSGASLLEHRAGRWSQLFKSRGTLQGAWRAPSSFHLVDTRGQLHSHRDDRWTQLEVGGDLLSVAGLDDDTLFCADIDGALVGIRRGKVSSRLEIGAREPFLTCASGRVFCGTVDGIFSYDGKSLRKEADGSVACVRLLGDELWAGGHQVGLTGTSNLYRRDRKGKWESFSADEIADHTIFDLVTYQGRMYWANGENGVVCDRGAVNTVEGTPPCYALAVIGDQLVGASHSNEAMISNGAGWKIISPVPGNRR